MNGYIDGARDVTKMNTTNVATFGSPNAGHLGIVQDGIAQYYMCPLRKHTMESEFGLPEDDDLPRVEILTCYAGIEEIMGLAIVATNPSGCLLYTSGSRLGAISVGIYIILGLIGVPVFTSGGGPGYVLQPTFGYLIGFMVGAYVVGRFSELSPKMCIRDRCTN